MPEQDGPKVQDSKVSKAIAYLKSFQPQVNKVARFAWTPLHGVAGIQKPEDPKEAEQAAKEADLQRRIDALRYVQERAQIQSMRDRLRSGN